MTYRVISASEQDHRSPLTTQLMEALEGNPTAIAAGDVGAPRIVNGALSSSLSSASVTLTGSAGRFYVALGAFAFVPAVGIVPTGVTVTLASNATQDGDDPKLEINDTVGSSATVAFEWRSIDA
jgi:hypothetical protein